MKLVIQRVRRAAVTVEGEVTGSCAQGLLVLVGVGHRSTADDARWLAAKAVGLRIFSDDQGRMNRSLADIDGGVLAISQFTLYGSAAKGRRPSFVDAAAPEEGDRLYRTWCEAVEAEGVPVGRGVFGAHMDIDAELDGPVTITLTREDGVTSG